MHNISHNMDEDENILSNIVHRYRYRYPIKPENYFQGTTRSSTKTDLMVLTIFDQTCSDEPRRTPDCFELPSRT
jgi:hypothetical protein